MPTTSSGTPALRRSLGLVSCTLMGVGVILGAGIYALVGKAAGLAGNAVWLSFLGAAAFSLVSVPLIPALGIVTALALMLRTGLVAALVSAGLVLLGLGVRMMTARSS